ncbi:MAG: transporter permease [Myxococcaceae bacterium]|nr:transporter permease [Myxococcaceae bacterium]
MVDLAMKSLLHDKLRFAITVSGVAFAVTLVLMQVGLFLGLLDNASITIEHTDADLWVTSRNTPNVDFAHTFPESRAERVRSTPGVLHADNLIVQFMNVQLPSGAEEGTVVYALHDFERWGIPWNITEGDVRELRRGHYMFFDASSVKRYGEFAVGDYREVFGQRIKIAGSTVAAKSFTTTPITFMDYDLAQSLNTNLRGNTTYVLVKVAPGADVLEVKKAIAERLPHNDVYTKEEWRDRSRSYWVQNTGIGLNMYITVFLGVLVGIVVVAQTLYTSTMEHLKEFGTVKAIGGSNLDIYKILARQASISAVLGFVIGVIPAFLMRPVMLAKADLKLILPPSFIAIVFVGTVAMCLLASMVSFRKVAAIDPGLVFRG